MSLQSSLTGLESAGVMSAVSEGETVDNLNVVVDGGNTRFVGNKGQVALVHLCVSMPKRLAQITSARTMSTILTMRCTSPVPERRSIPFRWLQHKLDDDR